MSRPSSAVSRLTPPREAWRACRRVFLFVVLVCALGWGVAACLSSKGAPDAATKTDAGAAREKILAEGNEDPLADEDDPSPPSASAEADPADDDESGVESGGKASVGTQNERNTKASSRTFAPAALPLPDSRTLFGLRRFLQDYGDAYRAYAPLQREYKALFQALAFLDEPDAKDLTQVRTRLREDVARAHWAFLSGVYETLDFLGNRSRDMLQIDKEKNFVRRMRVLAFLAEELDASAGTRDKYTGFVRALYMETSERHFGRKVKARGQSEEIEELDSSETLGDE